MRLWAGTFRYRLLILAKGEAMLLQMFVDCFTWLMVLSASGHLWPRHSSGIAIYTITQELWYELQLTSADV